MAEIRPYRQDDLEALYSVCLATGWAGADASAHYKDPKLVGHVYAAPYGLLRPDCAFVIEDDAGVGGYMLGAPDTPAFETELEQAWWPNLRSAYREPNRFARDSWGPDEQLTWLIHHPRRTPRRVTDAYPAHLHIDLLPRFQGRGFGRALMDQCLGCMRGKGAVGVHLGVAAANERALRFYRAYGFTEIWSGRSDKVLGMRLGPLAQGSV